jgi:sedoheptulokinase
MSQDFLMAAGVQRIVGSGTAIMKNTIMQKEIENQYKLQLSLCQGSEADSAVGAALAVLKYSHVLNNSSLK